MNGEFLVADEEIRNAYLQRIGRALARSTWQLLSYAIMSSHTHLALWAGLEPLGTWIQAAHSSFARWLQDRRRQAGSRARGPVFADRPTTVLVEPERVAYLIAYLHNNPVRAGLAISAEQSTWTSHRAYLGLVKPPPFVNVAHGLELTGFGADPAGRRAFDSLVLAHAGLDRDPELTASRACVVSARARERLGCSVQLAWPTLGESEVFPLLQRGMGSATPAFRGPAMDVVEAVAAVTGASIAKIQERGRGGLAVEARKLAILTWARFGRRPSEIATALALSRSAVSKAMSRAVPTERCERLIGAILREVLR